MNVNPENIPAELRARPQWVPWVKRKRKPSDKEPTKLPMLWNQKGCASSDDPNTWTTFENAMKSYEVRAYDGVAFMLSGEDPYTMFDLDDCIVDGKPDADAQATVDRFATYCEISPSETGLKGMCKGKFDGKGKNVKDDRGRGNEIYCRTRMFCFTGNHLAGTPKEIVENQAAVDWFYAKLGGEKKKPAAKKSRTGAALDGLDQDALAERCKSYLAKCPDAVSGQGGHNTTLRAACECFRFGLNDEHARGVMDWFNAEKTGGEPWSDDELQHKLDDARREVESSGEFGSRLISRLADRKDPLPLARRFVGANHHHPEHPTLAFTDDEFFEFAGTHWRIKESAAARQELYTFLEPLEVMVGRGDHTEIHPFKPTGRDVDNVIDAMKAVTYLPAKAPAWIGGNAWTMPEPSSLIVASNGIFELKQSEVIKLCDPTPRLFTLNALDYPLMPGSAPPLQWLAFLDEIFDDDKEQIDLVQEWFGYVLTADTRMQKMLLLIGPPRSGKGTIARIISRMIGLANVCVPTLAGIGTNFGLWPLIGKHLAIVSDARLSGRSDQAIVTERLLSISGEDSLTIDRKNRELLTTKLSTRIMVLSNELPKLADASGALASRFLILSLRKSFLGQEDTTLTEKLAAEISDIAAWSIHGLARLHAEGRFTEPSAADQVRQELNDLSSPIGAFLRDWCRVQAGASVACRDLYDAWRFWTAQQGGKAGTVQTFGRDVRAAVPGVRTTQPRDGEDRERVYAGIALTLAATEIVNVERAKEQRRDTPRHSQESEVRYA